MKTSRSAGVAPRPCMRWYMHGRDADRDLTSSPHCHLLAQYLGMAHSCL